MNFSKTELGLHVQRFHFFHRRSETIVLEDLSSTKRLAGRELQSFFK